MRHLPPLNAVRAFEAVARNRSFVAAARELNVTATAVSHQIRHLEALLGVKLLERHARGVRLSSSAERVFPLLQEGLDRVAEAFADIHERRSGATITVTSTRAFAERWMMPRLAKFRAQYPEVTVDLDASESVVDMRNAGIDVAVRYGNRAETSLESFLLFEDRFHPVIATRAAVGGDPLSIKSYRGSPLLAFRWKNPSLGGPTWAGWLAEARVADGEEFRVNWFSEEHLALQALDHGYGPLLASNQLLGPGLHDGTYQRIQGPSLPGFASRVILAPTAGRKIAVRRFVEWVRDEAAASDRRG